KIAEEYTDQSADLLIALHAKKSCASIDRWNQGPLIVALTGTDVYGEIPIASDPDARQSIEKADRIVVLQKLAIEELPPHLESKAVAIHQSAQPPPNPIAAPRDSLRICVIAHLRAVKDPFLIVEALRLLPRDSHIDCIHIGAAIDGQTPAEMP